MKSFKQHIYEAIIDIPRKTLAKDVFDGKKLKPNVKKFIEDNLKIFSGLAEVKDYHLIGSILTHRYRDDADLDVSVLLEPKADKEKIKEKLSKFNGTLLPGTKHPVNYFALYDKQSMERADELADGIFDVKSNKFIKVPEEESFDSDKYMEEFQRRVSEIDLIKGELNRDLIDFEQLKELSPGDVEGLQKRLQNKIDEIEESVKQLIDIFVDAKDQRDDIFKEPLTAKEIREYGSKNALPSNVIYKMLEKFLYIDFMKRIKKIIGPDNQLSKAEAEKIAKLKTPKLDTEIEEVLDKDADAGDYIRDFEKSDAPQFKGKSKEKRRQMAIAAYLANKKDKKDD